MLRLFSLGIDPLSSLKLVEYEEFDYFVNELIDVKRKNDARKDLIDVENFRIAYYTLKSKDGDSYYRKWKNDKKDIIKGIEIIKPKKQRTWFDNLRDEALKIQNKKENTFLDQVRAKNGV